MTKQSDLCKDAGDRPALEITDEMIDAGLETLRQFDCNFDSMADAVRHVFSAMLSFSDAEGGRR